MVAMFITGLAPIVLLATGLWVWLRKRRGERIAAAHAQARRAGHAGADVAANAAIVERGPAGAVARGARR
jgi:uncharacterized iron-regulated membrane protein